MGWAIGSDRNRERDIGYGVPAICDHPECLEEIDRGLGYVCGSDVYGGDFGCGLFFCSEHREYTGRRDNGKIIYPQLCERCAKRRKAFEPKPDTPEWINWKLTDESWGPWREENPEFVRLHATSTT